MVEKQDIETAATIYKKEIWGKITGTELTENSKQFRENIGFGGSIDGRQIDTLREAHQSVARKINGNLNAGDITAAISKLPVQEQETIIRAIRAMQLNMKKEDSLVSFNPTESHSSTPKIPTSQITDTTLESGKKANEISLVVNDKTIDAST